MWISSARSARRARSTPFCSAWAAPGIRWAAISKGRLFPLSRDELVECTALLDAVRRGELDRLHIPENALDVLTQQITAKPRQDNHDYVERRITMITAEQAKPGQASTGST